MLEPSDTILDVLVVGAGPTGLTLAAQLRAMGAAVRIVDRQLDRVHESRALAMQPRTLEVLRGLDVTGALLERGNSASGVQLHFDHRAVAIPLFAMSIEDTAYPFLLFISQAEIEEVLTHHLTTHGIAVERGVEMTAFQALADRVTATLQHGNEQIEEIRARYLVGCDGAHSAVRQGAGIPFEGGIYPQTFVLADLELDGNLAPGIVHAYIGERGILFFFPLKQPAPWRMQGLWPGPGEAPSGGEPSLEELQAIADAFTERRVRLRIPVWKTYFRVHHRQAASYRVGRVFLAGDAAHIHSPAGAQGMNTGIQDAWNLGWKLALAARGLGGPAILDSYQAERWPIGEAVVRISDRPFKVATAQNRLFRFMRQRVAPRLVPLVFRSRWLRTYGFRRLGQLAISYRRSAIVREGRPRLRRGPKAGDRLPDGKVVQEGREVWLQEALAALKFHLVLCGPRDGWDEDTVAAIQSDHTELVAVHRITRQPGVGDLHDPDGRVLDRLGVDTTAHYLIRPDGYVGFRAAGTDLRGVRRYLIEWLTRRLFISRDSQNSQSASLLEHHGWK